MPDAAVADAAPPAENGEVAPTSPPASPPDSGAPDGDKPDGDDPAPDLPESYAITRGEKLLELAGDGDDPVLAAVAEVAESLKLNKSELDAVNKVFNGLAEKLAEAGLATPLADQYSLEKELAGIERGKARFEAAEADITARRARNELSDGEAAALAGLIGTGDGIAVFEKLMAASTRRETPVPTPPPAPTVSGPNPRVTELLTDPRYRKDNNFRRLADREISEIEKALRG